MNDVCLTKFEEEWDEAEDIVQRAIIVFNLCQYCKQRYRGVQKLSQEIGPKVDYLEDNIGFTKGKDFLKVSRIIAYARREVEDSRKNYGAGFKRPLADDERDSIRKQYAPLLLSPDPDLEPETDSGSLNRIDLQSFGLGDDSD